MKVGDGGGVEWWVVVLVGALCNNASSNGLYCPFNFTLLILQY